MGYYAQGQRTQKEYMYFPGLMQQIDYLQKCTADYEYDSKGRLLSETQTLKYNDGTTYTKKFEFLYEESDIVGVIFTNSDGTGTYYYDKNPRGDVIAILDNSGNTVVKYTYDAYGNCNCTYSYNTDLANNNPIRYRSYYYDEDTGLYYLNARYYDPQWRRFISPDDTAYLDTESVNGLNLYAYCYNNPITYKQNQSLFGNANNNLVDTRDTVAGYPEMHYSANPEPLINVVLASGEFRNKFSFGNGKITGLYADGDVLKNVRFDGSDISIGAFGQFSLLNAEGQIGIGNDIVSLSLVGVADLGTISGSVKFVIDPTSNAYFIGIEGDASVFTAQLGTQFCLFGVKLDAGVSAKVATANFKFGIGIKKGDVYFSKAMVGWFDFDYYFAMVWG